jgi:glycosyltransferase involved in cell wall biosynthesis
MKNSPRVSVVLPTYNRAETLKRSIQFILSQSITDFELIVVDDASEDETKAVVYCF